MRMTKSSAIILARLIEALRPEWQYPGILAALATVSDRDAFDTVTAMTACAKDPSANTPAAISNPTYWANWGRTEITPSPGRPLSVVLGDLPPRDPESCRRGYQAATHALTEHQATKEKIA